MQISSSMKFLVPAGIIAAVLGSITISFDGEAAAIEAASQYLRAACGESTDRGWAMLAAPQRESRFRDEAEYSSQATASDCSGFDWDLRVARCDDGVCVIWFSVPNEDDIPGFLVDAGIVSYQTEKVPAGTNAGMAVLQRWIFNGGVIVSQP